MNQSISLPNDLQFTANALKEQVILITGAANGIGYAVAKWCAQQGAQVIAFDRQLKGLEKLDDEIKALNGVPPILQPIDFTGATPKNYADIAQHITQDIGQLNGLIHCAAAIDGLTPIEHFKIESWYVLQQINLNAPFLLTQSLLPLLAKSSNSTVIFTTDEAANGQAYWGSYGVAKAGLECLAKQLANEWETRGIRINLIDPGAVRTQLRIRLFPGISPTDWPLPDSIAPAYHYLLQYSGTGDLLRR